MPSRLDYFIRRMDRIKKAADSKIPPIPFTYTDPATVVATTIPLDPILIGRAKANLIPDCRQLPNGTWVRDVLPITVEYGELTDAGFSREQAYKLVQKNAMKAWKENSSFLSNIILDKKITNKIPVNKLKKLFNFSYHTKKINIIFKRSLKK